MSNDPMKGANARRPWTRPGDLAPHTRGVHMSTSTSTPLDPATYVPIAGMPNPIVAQLAHAIFAADSGLGAPTLESERALADADAGTREIYRRRAAAAYTTAARKVFPRAIVENFA